MVRKITAAEVAEHKSEQDCWLVVRGKVYDVTKYLDDHPGGVEIVTDLAGQDATEDYDDVGHSDEAHETLEEYLIGELDDGAGGSAATPAPSAPVAPKAADAPKAQAAPSPTPKPAPRPAAEADSGLSTALVVGSVVALAVGFFALRRRK